MKRHEHRFEATWALNPLYALDDRLIDRTWTGYRCTICGEPGFDASPVAVARLERLWSRKR